MHPLLAPWVNFYEIIGTAAAALVGLQFIAVTLITSADRVAPTMREMHAFGTPNIVLFSIALCVSAIMSAPWQAASHLGVCLLGLGLLGVLNSLVSLWHARKSSYKPDAEDWTWYVGLPLLSHATMVIFSAFLLRNVIWPLAGVAALTLSFLFIGIHNAWDTITYIATRPTEEAGS